MRLFESRFRAQRETLARRTFLKALAVGVSAPLAMQMSRMAIASGTRTPRLFIFFLPHGVPHEHFDVGPDMSLTASGEGILSPLEPYKKHLTFLRGVGILTATNHAAIRSALTGQEGNHSIDYEIATTLKLTPHVLGVQNLSGGGFSSDAQLVNHGGSYVAPIQNPADAVEDLFAGLAASATPTAPVVDDLTFRNRTLDLTIGEVEAMQKELSALTSEKTKLGIHLDSLRALKESGSGSGAAISCTMRPDLPSVAALAGQDVGSSANFGKVLDAHLEAAANALFCGSAQIITLQNMYANGQIPMDFPGGPGISKNHHDPLSHSLDAAGRKEFAIVQKWFYSRLAEKLLKVLDQPDPGDPEHTVLDNTTILTCSEISDGNGHVSNAGTMWVDGKEREVFQPWTIIGGGAGFFKGNQSVQFNNLDHRNILAACAEAMGAPISSFAGTSVSTPQELKA